MPSYRLEHQCDTLLDSTGSLQLTFSYTFLSNLDVHFTFYYPFAYSDCQRLLKNIDTALGVRPAPQVGKAGSTDMIGGSTAPVSLTGEVDIDRYELDSGSGTGSSRQQYATGGIPIPPHQVYYHRELLTLSPEGRRVELLTISSFDGIQSIREPKVEGLFPSDEPRPFRFYGKPVRNAGLLLRVCIFTLIMFHLLLVFFVIRVFLLEQESIQGKQQRVICCTVY